MRCVMMFAPCYLADRFGGGFNATEQDHLLVVRGLILMWMKGADLEGDWHQHLSRAVNEVNRILRLLGVQDPKNAPRPPAELFGYYRNEVSKQWDWLLQMSPNGWGR